MTVRAMKAGAVEFLTQPFREQELLEAVQRAISRHRLTRDQRAAMRVLQSRYELLTPREREVFPLVRQRSTQQASRRRTSCRARRRSKSTRPGLMQKMEAHLLSDLIRMAEQLEVSPQVLVT